MGQFEVEEDGGNDGRIGEKGQDPHWATTGRAEQWEHLVDTCEERGPSDASRVCRRSDWLVLDLGVRRWRGTAGVAVGRVGPRSADGNDGGAQPGVRRQHTVIPIPVNARWRDEPSKPLKELNRGEQDLGAPAWPRLGKAVEEPRVR